MTKKDIACNRFNSFSVGESRFALSGVLLLVGIVIAAISLHFGRIVAFAELDDMPGVPIETLEGADIDFVEDNSEDASAGLSAYCSNAISDVKNQGGLGTCWAFATAAAMESNAIKKGLTSPDGSQPDLSELSIAWYTHNNNLGFGGGKCSSAGLQLSRWIGPEWEYGLYNGSSAAYPIALSSPSSVAFSSTEAMSRDALHVNSVYMLNGGDVAHIKSLIYSMGAGTISLPWDQSFFSKQAGSDGRYSYNFPSSDCRYGHAVTLVGWDDNYSADNFNSNCRPACNGAWLVKNSWGTSLTSAPFFWVSYEACVGVRKNLGAVFFDVDDVLGDSDVCQVGRPWPYVEPLEVSGLPAAGNVFTAPDDGFLSSVNFYSLRTGVSYDVDVYRHVPKGGDPESGQLVAMSGFDHTASGVKRYAGMESVRLAEPIELEEGERYSIVVSMRDSGGEGLAYLENQTSSSDVYGRGSVSLYLEPLELGQSYLKDSSGNWSDQYSRSRAASIRGLFDRDVSYSEISGSTRYGTAAAAALDTYPSGSDGVIVCSGENYPDAISASGFAGLAGYPILLTNPASLSSETADAIVRLRSGHASFEIIVVGGNAAVSQPVVSALETLCPSSEVRRIYGETRCETSLAVLKEGMNRGGWGSDLVICYGGNYPDAVAASAYAASASAPIVLAADGGELPASAKPTVAAGEFSSSVIIGGVAAVPDNVKVALSGMGLDWKRLSGDTRYGTALAVARFAVEKGALSWDYVGIARGDGFADALAAGPAMACAGGVLLLASPSSSDDNALVAAGVANKGVSRVTWFGGNASLPSFVRTHLADHIG